ncbi:hypothetical protein D1872_248390 [compost metagenome]
MLQYGFFQVVACGDHPSGYRTDPFKHGAYRIQNIDDAVTVSVVGRSGILAVRAGRRRIGDDFFKLVYRQGMVGLKEQSGKSCRMRPSHRCAVPSSFIRSARNG